MLIILCCVVLVWCRVCVCLVFSMLVVVLVLIGFCFVCGWILFFLIVLCRVFFSVVFLCIVLKVWVRVLIGFCGFFGRNVLVRIVCNVGLLFGWLRIFVILVFSLLFGFLCWWLNGSIRIFSV